MSALPEAPEGVTLMAPVVAPTPDLSTRFGLVNVFPTTVVAGLVTVLVMAGAPARAPSLAALEATVTRAGAVGTAALAVGIVALSIISQPFELPLIRLLEGYWPAWPFVLRAAAWGAWLHERRRQRLLFALNVPAPGREAEKRAAERALERYPEPHIPLLPTALGNQLRAAETSAGLAYRIRAVRAWPRLYLVLPDHTRIQVDELRNQLDAAVRLSVLMALGAAITGALLLQHGWWLMLPVGLGALAGIAYRASVSAAAVYGEAVKAAFDVHHLLLLEQFGAKRPADTDEERNRNRELMNLFGGSLDITLQYRQEPP
jgi:hypothetical protein